MRVATRLFLMAGVSAIALSHSHPVRASGSCATAVDMAVLEERTLQTELMVAALTCKQSKQYNEFVGKRKKELMANGKSLREYFSRLYGGKSESKLNAFITTLANQVSRRSMKKKLPDYCAESAVLFSNASNPKVSLASIASTREYAALHGQKPCQQLAKANTTVKR